MSKAAAKAIVLGFLHVRTVEGTFRAGYLLANEYGRPLEFHYTNALTVSPRQQLLFGKDFATHLFAEVLGKPLTDAQRTAPRLILTRHPALLALRRLIPAPVVCLTPVADPGNTALENQVVPVMTGTDLGETGEALASPDAPPAASVTPAAAAPTAGSEAGAGPTMPTINLPLFSVQVADGFAQDLAAFERLRSLAPPNTDWLEPFERLEAALAEIVDQPPAPPVLTATA